MEKREIRAPDNAEILNLEQSQPFQHFILITDIATYRLNQPRGQCSENHPKYIRRWKVEMGLPLQSFSSIQGMDTRPAIYKKTPP